MSLSIQKLNHCYEQPKRKVELKNELKGNEKVKGKQPLKWGRPWDASDKGNVVPYKKFDVVEKGHGSHPGEQQNKGDGRGPLQCSIYGKDHRKKDFSLYQGSRPHIYNAQEAQMVGDVGHNIPHIYAIVDNKQTYHQASIIEMEGKLYSQVVSILIDLGSNYSYVNPDLVDKCGLRK